MSNFTPGPWGARGDTVMSSPPGVVEEKLRKREYPVSLKRIADCANPNYLTDEEVEANARLIAAAPEMYELLQDVLTWVIGTKNRDKIESLLKQIDGETE